MRRAALAWAALALLLAGCGPPEATPADAPVRDWSFLGDATDVSFADGDGTPFRWVLARPVAVDGELYLYVSTILGLDDGALESVLRDGAVQVRAGGVAYPARARRLSSAQEIDPLLPALLRQRLGVESQGAHYEPDPVRYPKTQVRQWFFRIEPEGRRADR